MITPLLIGVLLLLAALSITLLSPVPDKSFVALNLGLSFMVKLLLVFVYYEFLLSTSANGFGFDDELTYHTIGAQVANGATSLFLLDDPGTNNPGFIAWTAVIYRYIGEDTLIVRVFNVFFNSMWLLPVAILASYFGQPKITRLSVALVAWMPSLLLYSVLHIKDLLSGLLMLLFLAAVIKINPRNSVKCLLTGVLSLSLLWTIRKDLIMVLFCATFAYIVVSNATWRHVPRLLVLVCLLAVAIGVFASHYAESFYGRFLLGEREVGISELLIKRNIEKSDESNLLGYLYIKQPSELWKLPIAVAASLAIPFPPVWNGNYPHASVASFANVPFLLLLPFIFVGTIESLRSNRQVAVLIVVTVYLSMAFACVVSYAVLRYRDHFLPILLILASVGLVHFRKYTRLLIPLYSCFVAAVILYTFLKVT